LSKKKPDWKKKKIKGPQNSHTTENPRREWVAFQKKKPLPKEEETLKKEMPKKGKVEGP